LRQQHRQQNRRREGKVAKQGTLDRVRGTHPQFQ
jgi:hypothetical protein